MWFLIGKFLLLAGVVVIAAIFLARMCDQIAERTGLGGSLVGMVMLAAATSMPEFTVGWKAVRMGAIDLTMGDVLGSSLINLLILSLLDLMRRTRGQMLSKLAAAHALSATVSILLTGIILLFLVLKVEWTIWHLGPGTIVVLGAYLFCLRLVYFDQQYAMSLEPAEEAPSKKAVWPLVAGFAGGTTAILIAGPMLAETADLLAEDTGLGRTFFGTLFVAIITSLPEAVTTFEAFRLGSPDLAVGNIFGSNAFNMIVPAVADMASDQSILAMAASTHAITAVAVILVTCVAILGILYRVEKKYWILEPDAALMLLMILGALTLVYQMRP